VRRPIRILVRKVWRPRPRHRGRRTRSAEDPFLARCGRCPSPSARPYRGAPVRSGIRLDGNQTMRRFQPNDAAPGGGHADRTGCVRPESHVSHSTRHGHRRTATRTSREQLARVLSGLAGVPKYSLKPEGATANSLKFALPTIGHCAAARSPGTKHPSPRVRGPGQTLRASRRHHALTSMLSFTASFNWLVFSAGGQ
jgi:hypothetical protein